MSSMNSILAKANSVLPVVVLDDAAAALPLADALGGQGFSVLEITLRTSAAIDGIRSLAQHGEQTTVGAGTVLSHEQAVVACDAGAQFLVSPGFSQAVHQVAVDRGVPYLPGIATPSEAIAVAGLGYQAAKLFPASVVGGVEMIKALNSVLPELMICPTGGLSLSTMPDYLRQPNVPCVGGSWLVPRGLIHAGEWSALADLAAQTAALVARVPG